MAKFLVNHEKKQLFRLNDGDWPSFLPKNSATLLELLIAIACKSGWNTKPSYILWLRDEIIQFDSIEIINYIIDEYEVISTYIGGNKFIEHANEYYDKLA